MDTSNYINLGLLIVTLIVGLFSIWISSKAARDARDNQQRANDAAERAAECQMRTTQIEQARYDKSILDAKRALLHAELGWVPEQMGGVETKQNYIAVVNSGQATATSLQTLINGKAIATLREFAQLPADVTVGPRGYVRIPYDPFGDMQAPFAVELEWTDMSDERGHWVGSVS